MDWLPERWQRALFAIVAAPRAWSGLAALRRAGYGESLVAELEACGLVERWRDYPRGAVATLTPYAAELLDVVVDERLVIHRRTGIYREVQFWARRGEESTSVRTYPERGTCLMPFPERVADPTPATPADLPTVQFIEDYKRENGCDEVVILGVKVVIEGPRKRGQRRRAG